METLKSVWMILFQETSMIKLERLVNQFILTIGMSLLKQEW